MRKKVWFLIFSEQQHLRRTGVATELVDGLARAPDCIDSNACLYYTPFTSLLHLCFSVMCSSAVLLRTLHLLASKAKAMQTICSWSAGSATHFFALVARPIIASEGICDMIQNSSS